MRFLRDSLISSKSFFIIPPCQIGKQLPRYRPWAGKCKKVVALEKVLENSKLVPSCSARLQAGTLASSTCAPEGGRYMNLPRSFIGHLAGVLCRLNRWHHVLLHKLPEQFSLLGKNFRVQDSLHILLHSQRVPG